MKIIYHHRTLGDGAEGIHIEEMIAAFRSLGHSVTVISPVGEKTNTTNFATKNIGNIKKIIPKIFFEFIEIGYNLFGFIRLFFNILKDRPDFIYNRYITFDASSVFASKFFKIPLILEVNAPLALERRQQPDEKLYLWRFAELFERWICSNSTRTICVSTPLKDYLENLGVPSKKIVVLPNGTNLEKFKPLDVTSKLQIRKELNIPSDKLVLGFVGIMRPWHGIELLINAFLKVNEGNLFLLLIGDGPIRSNIESLLMKHCDSNSFKITGRVTHEKVAQYLNVLDIAISPKATFYASPMKLIEYMALEKAVLAPDTPNIVDLIKHNEHGYLFKNESEDSLTAALRTIVSNKDMRVQLGQNARKRTLDELNWRRSAEKIIKMVLDYRIQEVNNKV